MNGPEAANRPGLDALAYRAGTYQTFMRAMTARLAEKLPALTTRERVDPSIALLDGWAVVADVLTFYGERIANEGFLRTATEKRSVEELAKLVGYRPRPGVSASVFLGYTLEKGGNVTLAPGSKAQSVPGPGQTAQTFETADALEARDTWNVLGLRTTQHQNPAPGEPVYLNTVTTNLKPNDLLLFFADGARKDTAEHQFVRVAAVDVQPAQNRTKITLQGQGLVWSKATETPALAAASGSPTSDGSLTSDGSPASAGSTAGDDLARRIGTLQEKLLLPASAPPRSPQRLRRTSTQALAAKDIAPQLFAALHPQSADNVYAALANASGTPKSSLEVYAFRVHAAPYGHNAPPVPRTPLELGAFLANGREPSDWPLSEADSNPTILSLDARYDRVIPGSFVGIRTFPKLDANGKGEDRPIALFTVETTRERSRKDYLLSATTTVLTFKEKRAFFKPETSASGLAVRDVSDHQPDFGSLPQRSIDVFAQSERLSLAEVPIEADIPDRATSADGSRLATMLELDGLYDGLAPGRWAILTGTRTDLPGVPGAELVMIAAAEQTADPNIPGDTLHTSITLSTELAYTYARGSVTIWGNVVRATHGETHPKETIGSGDASQARQSFALKAKPLTFVASPTQSGAQSTLTVRVNGVRWTETDDMNAQGPNDRVYLTATTDAVTTVTFGDGVHGARLPTGTENIVATYRAGLGSSGNVAAGQISLLMSRPLGVKGVSNPLPATGGADAEARDAIRRNIPTALLALDRLVSLDDYASVTRTFAGVAKATVSQTGSGRSGPIFITLAGPGGSAIDEHGDLVTNLAAALRTLGDPQQAFSIASCERVLLLIGASVDLAADALWEVVEPAIRAALIATFAFDARDFGQPAYKSEAIAAIQRVPGVLDVTIDRFAGFSNASLFDDSAGGSKLERLNVQPMVAPRAALAQLGPGLTIKPAQFVAVDPSVRDTILLRLNSGGAAV